MMDSPEARGLALTPWLFGRQGLALLAFVTALASTVSPAAGLLVAASIAMHALRLR